MENYYAFLEIDYQAEIAQIELAIDEKYNYWRRLINHHDPQTAQEAGQKLLTLDAIRSTLLDASARTTYDNALGVNAAGGLVDPDTRTQHAAIPSPMMAPPSGTLGQGESGAKVRVDAWICPACESVNAIGTRFCQDCGEALGITCPGCNHFYQVTAAFCPNCGDAPDLIHQRQELQAQIQRITSEKAVLSQQLSAPNYNTVNFLSLADFGYGWAFFSVGVALLFVVSVWLAVFGSAASSQSWIPEAILSLYFIVAPLITLVARLLIWPFSFIIVWLFVRGKGRQPTIAWIFLAAGMFFSFWLAGANIRPGRFMGNNSLLLPSIIALIFVFIAAISLHKFEPRGWLGLIIAGILTVIVLSFSAMSSVFSLIAFLPMSALACILAFFATRAEAYSVIEAERRNQEMLDVERKMGLLEQEHQSLESNLVRLEEGSIKF